MNYEDLKKNTLNSIGELNTEDKKKEFSKLVNLFNDFEKTIASDLKTHKEQIEKLQEENKQLRINNDNMNEQLRKYITGSVNTVNNNSQQSNDPIKEFAKDFFYRNK